MASIDLRNVSRCQVAERGIIFLFCAAFRSGIYPLKAKSEEDAISWAKVINERIDPSLAGGFTNSFPVKKSIRESSIYDSEDDNRRSSNISGINDFGSFRNLSSESNDDELLDVNLIMNGALCVRFESECLHHSEKTSNIMPKEIFTFGNDANNKFPLDADIDFINGVTINITKMVMRNERNLSYMKYTIETFLNHDSTNPVTTVTRSYLQFEGKHINKQLVCV